MLAALSTQSLQRAIDLADWAQVNNRHSPFWANAEYQRRFANMSDAELGAAARILEARNAEMERRTAALDLLTAAMRVARLGAAS
ncbi:hypothetical protein [Sphingopyxis sp. 2PD]|uniref:hypothetical protein n=1 Tax=Sphingopyxis sp. 2PD TaxID=2502196 RepID=UPI0010F46BDA|nr:hypothetical protein [Sphingopyxis sp. 2PD]